ncbi:MAG: FHA domain-containing protein [Armatimonadetes bacterium]|nr:FHA domain-containing protein [Armatimonadota bacterium]
MGQVVFRAILGAVAGILAWLIFEPQFARLPVDPTTGIPPREVWGPVEVKFILTLGAMIGATVGALNGWIQGSRTHLLRGLGLGLLLGFFGVWLGYRVGNALLASFFPVNVFDQGSSFGVNVLARVVAFAPMGLLLGGAIGASGLTARRLVVGAVGGLIGAAIGGLIFDSVSALIGGALLDLRAGATTTVAGIPRESGEVGLGGRAMMALILGGVISLFIGIVDRVTRTAWVKLILGKNEGKEWVVEAPQTFIGRSETAHIPLHGDMNVAPMHACISRQGNAYILMDGGSPIGTLLNGMRVQHAPLFDGAQIQIGPHLLHFMLKQGSAPQRAAESLRGQMASMAPQGQAAFAPIPTPYPGGPGLPASPMPQPSMPSTFPPTGAPSQPTQVLSAQPLSGGCTLLALDGPIAGQRFDIRSPIEVGREAPGIPLAFDAAASRRHASLSPGNGGVSVQDLGSTNGTFVNGQRIITAQARIGDVLKVGSTSFRVETA